MKIKYNNIWRDVIQTRIKFNDQWRTICDTKIKRDGVWRNTSCDVTTTIIVDWSDGQDLDLCLEYCGARAGFSCGTGLGWSGDNQFLGSESFTFTGPVGAEYSLYFAWYDIIGTGAGLTINSSSGYTYTEFVSGSIPLASQTPNFECACDLGFGMTLTIQ